MTKCILDTETCGLHGMAVTLQYAFDDGPVKIHEFWREPIEDTLQLIEQICECAVIGFNLAFDWFHISKIYTIFRLCPREWIPEDHIDEISKLEERGRDGPCVKPAAACDLMLHARKTEFQSTMERSDIRIRRVPTGLAYLVAKKLEAAIVMDSLLFARTKNKFAPRWVVHDIEETDDFKDIVLKFKPSVALKALALHVLKIPPAEILAYGDIEVPKVFWPAEVGYAPFAAAIERLPRKLRDKFKKKRTWPKVIKHHINHWAYHKPAREYASKDVVFTRRLYEYFGSPPPGDDDSELACSVGAVRWRGYAIDIPAIEVQKEKAQKLIRETPTAPHIVKRWISSVMSETERKMFVSTKKVVLEKMANQITEVPGLLGLWEKCPFGKCEECNNTGWLPAPESNKRAKLVLEARTMKKEIELYDKLIVAKRFHASFKVIGALSGRMAGADKLNPQGIKRTTEVRSCFPLAFGGLDLWGGDFAGFEVTLADAAYNDPLLRKDLLTCENCRDVQVVSLERPVIAKEWLEPDSLARFVSIKFKGELKKQKKNPDYLPKSEEVLKGMKLSTFACRKCGCNDRMKIHALFGVNVYEPMTYDEIKATDGKEPDLYNRSKSAVFAMIYGGMAFTLMTRLGVPIEIAEAAYQKFIARYVGIGKSRQRIIDAFCSIRQSGGIGTKVEWNDPAEYVESILGFKRWFTLENMVVKAVFEIAQNPPEEWTRIPVKVRRRDREQSIAGAVRSALFACAFGIQSSNMRAAANHEIQSSGAGITKRVQRKVWDVQPHGVHPWLVQPCNIHDQVLCPTHPSVQQRVAQVVFETVESFRGQVPLIELDWKPSKSWGDK